MMNLFTYIFYFFRLSSDGIPARSYIKSYCYTFYGIDCLLAVGKNVSAEIKKDSFMLLSGKFEFLWLVVR